VRVMHESQGIRGQELFLGMPTDHVGKIVSKTPTSTAATSKSPARKVSFIFVR
jgi:hypothetical protein